MPRSCSLCVFRVSFRGCGPVPSPPGRFACAGEGVVEYSGKVACPSGRRCSTRNAVWCHSHPGFKSQRYRHCRPAPLGPGGFVMPSVYVWGTCGSAGVPGTVGRGCGAGLLGVPVGGDPPASRPRCVLLLVAPLVFRAPEGPAAREARASLRSAPRLEARPCPPVPPAPSTPASPGR